jgi:hypothetical protein
MDDKKIVQESLLEIFRLNGWSHPGSMTQRDFEHISIELQKKSGIVISGITIKRLANGSFSRMPQIATLNAIANYFDFKTWQEYKSSVNRNEKNANTPEKTSPAKKKKLTLPARLGLVLLAIILTGLYFLPQKWQGSGFETASFSASKTTGNDIPNTVVFNYNIDDVQADSFFIQQSWDKNRRVRIYKNTHTLTDIYYEPGYHIAKLIANDSIITAVPVSIPTRDWFFYANENKIRYQTEYIKADGPLHNGLLALSPLDLTKNRIAPEKGKLYLYSYFPQKLEVSSENFSLKTRVRMKEISNNFCPYIGIEVHAQRYFMLIKSTPKGCASEATVYLGEKTISGKDTDLSAISFDVTQWTDIELTVKNKQAIIKINGKESFSGSYNNDTKLITGLSFISNGLCEVDNVELKGVDGRMVYKNDF